MGEEWRREEKKRGSVQTLLGVSILGLALPGPDEVADGDTNH